MCYYLKIHPHFSQRAPPSIFVFPTVKIALWCSSPLCLAFVATGQAHLYSLLAGHQRFTGFISLFWIHYFHGFKLSSHLPVEEVSRCCGVVWCFVVEWGCGWRWGVINAPHLLQQTRPLIRQSPGIDFYKIASGIRCCSIGRAQQG